MKQLCGRPLLRSQLLQELLHRPGLLDVRLRRNLAQHAAKLKQVAPGIVDPIIKRTCLPANKRSHRRRCPFPGAVLEVDQCVYRAAVAPTLVCDEVFHPDVPVVQLLLVEDDQTVEQMVSNPAGFLQSDCDKCLGNVQSEQTDW